MYHNIIYNFSEFMPMPVPKDLEKALAQVLI